MWLPYVPTCQSLTLLVVSQEWLMEACAQHDPINKSDQSNSRWDISFDFDLNLHERIHSHIQCSIAGQPKQQDLHFCHSGTLQT